MQSMEFQQVCTVLTIDSSGQGKDANDAADVNTLRTKQQSGYAIQFLLCDGESKVLVSPKCISRVCEKQSLWIVGEITFKREKKESISCDYEKTI